MPSLWIYISLMNFHISKLNSNYSDSNDVPSADRIVLGACDVLHIFQSISKHWQLKLYGRMWVNERVTWHKRRCMSRNGSVPINRVTKFANECMKAEPILKTVSLVQVGCFPLWLRVCKSRNLNSDAFNIIKMIVTELHISGEQTIYWSVLIPAIFWGE